MSGLRIRIGVRVGSIVLQNHELPTGKYAPNSFSTDFCSLICCSDSCSLSSCSSSSVDSSSPPRRRQPHFLPPPPLFPCVKRLCVRFERARLGAVYFASSRAIWTGGLWRMQILARKEPKCAVCWSCQKIVVNRAT